MINGSSSNAARQPVLFVSHGAPTFALQPGIAGAHLTALGRALNKPEAVLVVSPHWRSQHLRIAGTTQPQTIHDFAGFPDELYNLRYPAPGAPAFAELTIRLLQAAGYKAELDMQQGLDHGAWIPLQYLFPQAVVPVFQVSMPHDLSSLSALALGHSLASLADEGVLIIGSGSLTHNLYEFQMNETFTGQGGEVQTAPAYVDEFVSWVRKQVISGKHDQLVRALVIAPHATRTHPSPEHFLPLLVAAGAAGQAAHVTVLNGGVTHKILSMESYAFGLPMLR